jgi:hypothetical protein
VLSRHALPYDGQPGGASEYIFPGKFGPDKGLVVVHDGEFTLP